MENTIVGGIEVISPEAVVKGGDVKSTILTLNPHSANIKKLKVLVPKNEGVEYKLGVLQGDIHPIRCGYNHEGSFFIVPKNGPILVEKDVLPGNKEFRIHSMEYDYDEDTYLVLFSKDSK